MKIFKNTLLIGLLFFSINVFATPASDSSVRQLLAAMHARKLTHRLKSQYRSIMTAAMQRELKGIKVTPKQEKIIKNMTNAVSNTLQEEVSWKKLEPMYLREYKKTFSEKEVEGMLAFFKTPAGQAYANKVPLLTHNIMLDYEKNMGPVLMQRLQRIYKKFMKEFISASK